MAKHVENFLPLLREAIAEAHAAGLGALAKNLEDASSAGYTSSSELLGEIGQAIVEFLHAGGDGVPHSTIEKLSVCLQHVRTVWPGIHASSQPAA